MSLPRSVWIAAAILVSLLIYFGASAMLRPAETGDGGQSLAETQTEDAARAPPRVVVTRVALEPHPVFRSFKGQTEPERVVTVRAETQGSVREASVAEGALVEAGTVLCGLNVESRAARLAEARAAVESARLDYEAARDLADKGWTSPTQAAAAKAQLDAAEAALDTAEVELERTRIRAPFSGVFERRLAEEGDFLSPGQPCGELVDLDPLIIAVNVPEGVADDIEEGQRARAELADGRTFPATVRYVARTADPATRTFRVEAAAPNPDSAIAAGLTAELRLELGRAPAARLSPAMLVLDDTGEVGVRYVDEDDTVRFTPVRVIDDAPDGVWLTGLPEGARLLTEGQEFVREGTRVDPVLAEGL